ncbi:MAG: alpha/beta fold hydrolase [Verrucomicrobiota bacterium JB023]|nr:alpha/beta fold hydrolase [Verrucomicrobiota bacterium JB023]
MNHGVLLAIITALLVSCSGSAQELLPVTPPKFAASDGKELPIRYWNLKEKPRRVIIGLHGISGAAKDFENLGKKLQEDSTRTTLYALNLRGQGLDPAPGERGDIEDEDLWKRDLREFHEVIQQRHPEASIVWMGESMGALIALHTAAGGETQPRGLILASPIVSLDKVPRKQQTLLRSAAKICPICRVSLKTLAGGSFEAISGGNHFDQAEKNPYQIEEFTFRLLDTVGSLVTRMPEQARQIALPVLILHGGQDPLSNPEKVKQFADNFEGPVERVLAPESHHLLFYDISRTTMIHKTLQWLDQANF